MLDRATAPTYTFSQTIRFQNPIMESSIGDAPCHVCVSLMATTYMKCRINSIVNRQSKSEEAPYCVTVFNVDGSPKLPNKVLAPSKRD